MTKTVNLKETYQPSKKQALAHRAAERFVLYGGAVGGGKSAWMVNEVLQLSLEANRNVGYLCRHELTSFRRSTLMTLERFIPPELVIQHHQTESFIRLINGSMIFYGGLGDDQGAIDRLKSMDLGWFAIDQAEETSEAHFFLLASRLRLNVDGVRYKGLLSANPTPGWVKHRFIEQSLDDHVFVPALPKDNPHLPSDYEENLRKLYPSELVKQLLEGDWDVLETGNNLLRYSDIRGAVDREIKADTSEAVRVIGVDIARFGDDSSAAIGREGTTVVLLEQWVKSDLMDTAGRIASLIQQFEPDETNIDAIGLGAGVVDRLREQHFQVNAIESSSRPDFKDNVVNLRAEMYDELRELFELGEVSIPNNVALIAELSGIKYRFNSNGKLLIESKEEMKKRGIKSPDLADALALTFKGSTRTSFADIRWL